MATSQDLSQSVGKGIDIVIGDKTWTLSPLKIGDLSALQENIRNRRLASARTALGDLPTAQLVDILCDITKTAIDGETMDKELETLAGCQFAIWRSLRKTHKDMTLEKVGELFSIDDLVVGMLPHLKQLSGLEDEDQNPPKAEKETP